MVAVCVFALVAYQSACYAAQLVGIASCGSRRLVHVAQEARYGILDGVGTAERADESGLLGRVARLLYFVCYDVALTAAHGPAAHVVGVGVLSQYLVNVACRTVLVLEHVWRVLAGARPVEQSRQLVGSVVEKVYAQFGGYLTAQRFILGGLHLSVEWENQTESRMLVAVLVCAVQHGGEAERAGEVIPHVQRAVVDVECSHCAVQHVGVLSGSLTQVAADKAAHILDVALLVTAHVGVLGCGLVGALCLAAALQKLRPLPVAVAPFL